MSVINTKEHQMQVLEEITRLEVISTYGREMVRYFSPGTVRCDVQDQGTTLKIFLMEPSVPGWKYNGNEFTVSDLRVIAKLHNNMFVYGSNPTLDEVIYTLNVLRQEGLPFEEDEQAG